MWNLKPTTLSATNTPFARNMAWKDNEWTKVGSIWKCEVDTYILTYCAKWLLTKHLKEVHGLVAKKKAKLGKPSTSEKGP